MDENPSDFVGKEFIFEYGLDRIMLPSEETGGTFALEQRCYRRERVVRCRDCVMCEHKAIGNQHRGYFREWDYCYHWAEDVEPDGFCAWGEPRGGK